MKQGSMSIPEYHDKFAQLSRYAPNEVADDADKQRRFLKDLYYGQQLQLISNTFSRINCLCYSLFLFTLIMCFTLGLKQLDATLMLKL